MRVNKIHPKFAQLAGDAPIPRKALNMREVGVACGVSWQTVYRQVKKGKLAVIPGTSPWLIATSELDRFLRDEAIYNPSRRGRRKKEATP